MKDPQIKAAEAKQLLENPILKEAFEDVRNALVAAAEKAGMNDVETQHNIVLSLQLLKQIKDQIQNHINTGIIEEFKLKEKDKWHKKLFG